MRLIKKAKATPATNTHSTSATIPKPNTQVRASTPDPPASKVNVLDWIEFSDPIGAWSGGQEVKTNSNPTIARLMDVLPHNIFQCFDIKCKVKLAKLKYIRTLRLWVSSDHSTGPLRLHERSKGPEYYKCSCLEPLRPSIIVLRNVTLADGGMAQTRLLDEVPSATLSSAFDLVVVVKANMAAHEDMPADFCGGRLPKNCRIYGVFHFTPPRRVHPNVPGRRSRPPKDPFSIAMVGAMPLGMPEMVTDLSHHLVSKIMKWAVKHQLRFPEQEILFVNPTGLEPQHWEGGHDLVDSAKCFMRALPWLIRYHQERYRVPIKPTIQFMSMSSFCKRKPGSLAFMSKERDAWPKRRRGLTPKQAAYIDSLEDRAMEHTTAFVVPKPSFVKTRGYAPGVDGSPVKSQTEFVPSAVRDGTWVAPPPLQKPSRQRRLLRKV